MEIGICSWRFAIGERRSQKRKIPTQRRRKKRPKSKGEGGGGGEGGEKEGREKIKHKDVKQFMKYEKKKGRGRTYRDKRKMKRGVYK